MQVFILAGGLGTRIRSVLGDVPKPMAAIGGRPFLEYLILQIRRAGLRRVIVCTGYRADVIERYFGTGNGWDMDISYSREPEPLGTGGALRLAASRFPAKTSLVMNGDSFFDIQLETLCQRHQGTPARVTMALARGVEGTRYGIVETDRLGAVTRFQEKPVGLAAARLSAGHDLINAGLYVVEGAILAAIPDGQPVSLEREVLPMLVGGGLRGEVFAAPFTDIGVAQDLALLRAAPERLLLSEAD
ncbi:MAG: nucleotidyltransferase family protein [Candidatus Limnocylindrales bacterium]